MRSVSESKTNVPHRWGFGIFMFVCLLFAWAELLLVFGVNSMPDPLHSDIVVVSWFALLLILILIERWYARRFKAPNAGNLQAVNKEKPHDE